MRSQRLASARLRGDVISAVGAANIWKVYRTHVPNLHIIYEAQIIRTDDGNLLPQRHQSLFGVAFGDSPL
jgi:hypothetical protein